MHTTIAATNNVIAGQIASMLATTMPSSHVREIKKILDANYRNRRAGAASKNGRGAARTGDMSTSVEAASKAKVIPSMVKILRVMESFRSPRIVDEIVTHAGLPLNSGSTRFAAMRKEGLVMVYDTVMHNGSRKSRYCIAPLGDKWIESHGDRYSREGEADVAA